MLHRKGMEAAFDEQMTDRLNHGWGVAGRAEASGRVAFERLTEHVAQRGVGNDGIADPRP